MHPALSEACVSFASSISRVRVPLMLGNPVYFGFRHFQSKGSFFPFFFLPFCPFLSPSLSPAWSAHCCRLPTWIPVLSLHVCPLLCHDILISLRC